MGASGKDRWVDRLGDCEEVVLSSADGPLESDPSALGPEELGESYRRLVRLYHLGQRIYSDADSPGVFRTILSAAVNLLDVERAFLAVLSGGKLAVRAAHQIDLSGDPATWPISRSMLRRVLADGVITILASRCLA